MKGGRVIETKQYYKISTTFDEDGAACLSFNTGPDREAVREGRSLGHSFRLKNANPEVLASAVLYWLDQVDMFKLEKVR